MKLFIKQSLFLISFFLLFLTLPFFAQAKEGECANLPCFVPAPTIILPENNSFISSGYITGLTWKTTFVKIFVDGQELNNIKLVKHEDYYASFAAPISSNLKAGKHEIYAFAYDEKDGWGGISQESKHTFFTIKKTSVKQEIKKTDNVSTSTATSSPILKEKLLNEAPLAPAHVINIEAVKGDDASVSSTDDSQAIQPATDSVQEIATNSEKETTKTVSDYQKSLKTNRIVGFVILTGLVLISLLWLLIKKDNEDDDQNNNQQKLF
jgi:hypothetical protein